RLVVGDDAPERQASKVEDQVARIRTAMHGDPHLTGGPLLIGEVQIEIVADAGECGTPLPRERERDTRLGDNRLGAEAACRAGHGHDSGSRAAAEQQRGYEKWKDAARDFIHLRNW